MSDKILINGIALVLQGGGTRGAFTAGVLDVLMEHGIQFNYVIGTSAGALNAVNYISGDIGRSRKVSTELMLDRKFVGKWNMIVHRGIFNFDYLFHVVPKTKLPFNAQAYESSNVTFVVAATRMEDGFPVYFNRKDFDDFYPAIAASASLPLVSRPVKVGNGYYLDGGVSAAIPFRKPFADGYQKVVIVETRALGYEKPNPSKKKLRLAKFLYRRFPGFLDGYRIEGDIYNKDEELILRLQADGKAFVIRPDVPPQVTRTEKDQKKLNALYETGRQVMERHLEDLLVFCGVRHE